MEPHDAGQQVQCQCGASLEVPTLRHLRQLPVAPPTGIEETTSPRPWSYSQGMSFSIGLVTLVLAVVALFHLGRQRSQLNLEQPVFPYQELVARELSQWDVTELWAFWAASRNFKLDTRQTPQYLVAREAAKRIDRLLIIAAGFGIAGVVTMLTTLAYRPKARTPSA